MTHIIFLPLRTCHFSLSKTHGSMAKDVQRAPESAVYGLGFIGAAVYYISTAASFWAGVGGFLKAVVWPAFTVYELLKYIGA